MNYNSLALFTLVNSATVEHGSTVEVSSRQDVASPKPPVPCGSYVLKALLFS